MNTRLGIQENFTKVRPTEVNSANLLEKKLSEPLVYKSQPIGKDQNSTHSVEARLGGWMACFCGWMTRL